MGVSGYYTRWTGEVDGVEWLKMQQNLFTHASVNGLTHASVEEFNSHSF